MMLNNTLRNPKTMLYSPITDGVLQSMHRVIHRICG